MDYEEFKNQFNRYDTFSVEQGIRLIRLGYGYAEASVDITKDHYNMLNSTHGGLLFTLCDIVADCCLSTKGQKCVTLAAGMNFVRPAYTGKLRAEAKAVKMGRTIGVGDVIVYNESNKTVCSATFTMFYKENI